MLLRTKKRLLVMSSILLTAIIGAVCWWGFAANPSMGIGTASSQANRAQVSRSSSAIPQTLAPAMSELTSRWGRPLRRPLYDPPPPPPPRVEQPPPRPIQAKLLATMIESGNAVAMLQLNSGDVVFRKRGDMLDTENANALIHAIEPGKVTISRGEERVVILVE